MSLVFVQMVIAALLLLSGVGLMVWSYVNPKWQHADAFDALTPFAIGCVLLVIAFAWFIALAVYSVFSG